MDEWKNVEVHGLPKYNPDVTYVGINSAGYAACFSTVEDDDSCWAEGAEESVCVMSELRWWRVLDRPGAASPVAAPTPLTDEPRKWRLDKDAAALLHTMTGSDDAEEATEVTLFVGESRDDDGKPVYGLHAYESDYPEEGVIPLVECAPPAAAASPAQEGWQPIETAPKVKDAPLLLTNGVSVAQGWWMDEPGYIRERRDEDGRYIDQDESDGYTGWMDCDGGMLPEPTHWMQLPPPPGDEPPAQEGRDARDAARYRWLREQEWFSSPLCVLREPKRVLTRGIGLGADCPSLNRLDAAIDAALGASAAKGETNGN